MYRTRNTDYFSRLTVQGKKIFRSSELALIWGITNKNTLHTTLVRYQRRGLLCRLTTGIYSVLPFDRLNPYEIGVAIAGPLSYISCETVLADEGLINQPVFGITLVGKKRKEFTINQQKFLCRYLNAKYLVNRLGVENKDGYAIASPLRATADLKFVLPNYHLDGINQINKKDLQKLNKQLGYQ